MPCRKFFSACGSVTISSIRLDHSRAGSSAWRATIASIACGTEAGSPRLFGTDDVERDTIPSELGSPLDALLARERGRELRQAVADLPVKYRVPTVLAYFNELGYAEIAQLLGIERSHVAVLLFRGRQRLRRMLTAPNRNPR